MRDQKRDHPHPNEEKKRIGDYDQKSQEKTLGRVMPRPFGRSRTPGLEEKADPDEENHGGPDPFHSVLDPGMRGEGCDSGQGRREEEKVARCGSETHRESGSPAPLKALLDRHEIDLPPQHRGNETGEGAELGRAKKTQRHLAEGVTSPASTRRG